MLGALPYSFTAHAKDIYTSKPEQLREKIEKAAFVVTCTEYNRKYLQHVAGGDSTPVYRVYHGIDVRFFQNEAETPAAAFNPSPPYRILTVARLVEKIGIPTVLEALKSLKARGIAFTYTLIGDGDDRMALEKQAADLDLRNETTFTGTKPHDYVLDAYRNTDLFVLGCQVAENGDRDGIPNVLMESMAMGVPVVVTAVSAIPELVENEKTGLLVPPRDPAALAGAMKRLLTDGTLRKTVIEAGRKRVVEEFDNRDMIRDLAGIFRRGIAP
jgi:glycosyltransferase involved in cell wall biosynthesis